MVRRDYALQVWTRLSDHQFSPNLPKDACLMPGSVIA